MTPELKCLVIAGSARGESNTMKAVQLLSPYPNYEVINLVDHQIAHYDYEKESGDDFLRIVERMLQFDVILFATPVYWYSMSGRMKVFFDRFSELISTRKMLGRALAGKKVFLIAQGAGTEMPVGLEIPIRDTAHYFAMEYLGSQYLQMK